MEKWFITTIQYEKEIGGGKSKKVKESFLVSGIDFGEAENRIIEEARSFISNEFEVESVKREIINEMFKNEEGGSWFKVKLNFFTTDEYGKEKKTKNIIYVQCMDIENVIEKLTEGMKGTMSDWKPNSIVETNILDVFEFDLNK